MRSTKTVETWPRPWRYAAAIAVMMLGMHPAEAQDALTEAALVEGLAAGNNVAVLINPSSLAAEVQANVGKGVASLPTWSQLSQLAQLTVELNFEYNSVALVPESYRAIGLIADALHHPILLKHKFLIVGHTDGTGNAEYNLGLSLKRAQAIQEALTTTFAVSPDRVFAVGVGEELPIDPAHPDSAINRRVQLVNIGLAN